MAATVRIVQKYEDDWVLMEYDAVTQVDQDPLTLAYQLRHVLMNGRVIDHCRTDDVIDLPEVPECANQQLGRWVRGNLLGNIPTQEPTDE